MRRRAPVRRFKQPEAAAVRKIPRRRGPKKPQRYKQPPAEAVASAPRLAPIVATVWGGPDAHLRSALRAAVSRELLTEPLIAVLVPVLARPHRVRPLLESFRAATSSGEASIYFIAQRSDEAEVAAICAEGLEPILVADIDRSWSRKINRGYESTTEPWLLLGADDLKFHRGWVRVVKKLLQVHAGVIGTNDLGNAWTRTGVSSTHPLVRRAYADVCGTVDERRRVVHEGYQHNFADSELVSTAKRRGLYVHALNCVVEHLHPAWGKAKSDATYRLGQSTFQRDSVLYTKRGQRFGW